MVALALILCAVGWAGVSWASPVISAVSPGGLKTGVSGQQVVVTCTGCPDGQIFINGVGVSSWGSGVEVWGVVPGGAVAADGSVAVKIRNYGSAVDSNTIDVPVTVSGGGGASSGGEEMVYVVAGLLAASAFIAGMGQKWY